jgi:hypothetical protein
VVSTHLPVITTVQVLLNDVPVHMECAAKGSVVKWTRIRLTGSLARHNPIGWIDRPKKFTHRAWILVPASIALASYHIFMLGDAPVFRELIGH